MKGFISHFGGLGGSAAAWDKQYERLSKTFSFDPKEGVSLEVFKEMMGCDDELVEAPEEAQVKQ